MVMNPMVKSKKNTLYKQIQENILTFLDSIRPYVGPSIATPVKKLTKNGRNILVLKVSSRKNGISDLRWSDKGAGCPVSHKANQLCEPWESAMTCLTDSDAWRTSPMRQSVSQFPLFFAWSDSGSKRSSLAAALCTG